MKINIIEDSDFLNSKSKDFINEVILGNNFPYYLQKDCIEGDENKFLSHIVLTRIENRKNNDGINSNFYPYFIDILNQFTTKHNIKYKEICRISVNFSFKLKKKIAPIHIDHKFKHNQLLVYLNNLDDKEACTLIYDKSRTKIIKKIIPKQYKGVFFNGVPHTATFPKIGERIVLVCTFR